jgi:hypothetical protein
VVEKLDMVRIDPLKGNDGKKPQCNKTFNNIPHLVKGVENEYRNGSKKELIPDGHFFYYSEAMIATSFSIKESKFLNDDLNWEC